MRQLDEGLMILQHHLRNSYDFLIGTIPVIYKYVLQSYVIHFIMAIKIYLKITKKIL